MSDGVEELWTRYANSLSRHVVQILRDDEQGRPEAHGSALLVASSAGAYLVSAAHVFDPMRSGTRLYFGVGDHKNRNLLEDFVLTPEGSGREEDRLDIGVLQFGPFGQPPYPLVDKVAVPVGALRRNAVPRGDKQYLAVGYPGSKSVTDRRRKEVRSEVQCIHARSVSENLYTDAGLHPRNHIAMQFNRGDQYTLDGCKQTAPHPGGMSGCPIWLVRDDQGDNDSRFTPAVGISIEYNQRDQLLIGTDIGVALDMIATFEREPNAV